MDDQTEPYALHPHRTISSAWTRVHEVIQIMDLTQLQAKASKNLRRFFSEKMKENEH